MGILLTSILVIVLILRGAKNNTVPPSDIALCDQNPGELCIVTFGANDPDRMVINFQLPDEEYPVFYVKGLNRGITYDYSCYSGEDAPTSVYCTGPRTPLGEYIELEVYAVEDNLLLARGRIFVSAVIVWTPASITATPSINDTPAATSATEGTGTVETGTVEPFQTNVTTPQAGVTPSPGTAYPNP